MVPPGDRAVPPADLVIREKGPMEKHGANRQDSEPTVLRPRIRRWNVSPLVQFPLQIFFHGGPFLR
jgi:hypothetical protein